MLGDVIGAESRPVILLGELEPRLEQIGERNAVIVEMIENTKFEWHERFPLVSYPTYPKTVYAAWLGCVARVSQMPPLINHAPDSRRSPPIGGRLINFDL